MPAENLAVIFSRDNSSIKQIKDILKKIQFNVQVLTDIDELKISRDSKNINLCFVGNSISRVRSKEILKFFNQNFPQTLIVTNRSDIIPQKDTSNLIFYINPDIPTFDLEIFFKNFSEFIIRERSRMELAAMLVHDARSPMNSLVGYLELLLNETFGQLNEGQKNLIEKAIILGDKTLDMLEDINEVYQSEQYIFRLEREIFDLEKVVDEVMVDMWIRADQKNIKIHKEFPKSFPSIYGDGFQLQRVFTNLLTNGIKYCADNSQIIIKGSVLSPSLVQVSVIDNGGGVPEEQLKHIFDKFFRVASNKQYIKGYGLGLYICKLIIKAHGGKIWVENNDLGGLSFHFTLPVKTK